MSRISAGAAAGPPRERLFETGRFEATETLHCRLTRKAVFDVVLDALEARFLRKRARRLPENHCQSHSKSWEAYRELTWISI